MARTTKVFDRCLAGLALEDATTAFLAALSWVWDMQEREARSIDYGSLIDKTLLADIDHILASVNRNFGTTGSRL